MANVINTTGTLSQALRDIYSADLIIGAEAREVFQQYCERWPEPGSDKGKTVTKTIFRNPKPALAELHETTDVDGSKMSTYQVSITVHEYGDAYELTEKLTRLAYLPVIGERVRQVGFHMGITMDTFARNAFWETANKWYAGGRTARSGLTSADVLTETIARQLTRNLERRDSEMFGLDTFMGVIAPDVKFTIQGLEGWVTPAEYANDARRIWRNEMGMWRGIRWVVTSRAILRNAGAIGEGHQTALDGAVTKGATSFDVLDASGFAANDEITIGYPGVIDASDGDYDALTEEVVIKSISDNKITLDDESHIFFDHVTATKVTLAPDIFPVVVFGPQPVAWAYALPPEPRFRGPIDKLQRLNSVGWYTISGWEICRSWRLELVEVRA